jgi:hypothetical protein
MLQQEYSLCFGRDKESDAENRAACTKSAGRSGKSGNPASVRSAVFRRFLRMHETVVFAYLPVQHTVASSNMPPVLKHLAEI